LAKLVERITHEKRINETVLQTFMLTYKYDTHTHTHTHTHTQGAWLNDLILVSLLCVATERSLRTSSCWTFCEHAMRCPDPRTTRRSSSRSSSLPRRAPFAKGSRTRLPTGNP
jgi:hypothetical protein